MKFISFLPLGLLCCLALPLAAGPTLPELSSTNEDQERYIRQYKDIAIREMERQGVPASIKLAQGILESDAGRSYLARNAQNHFGIKCGSNWNGGTVYREDDDYDDDGRLTKSCFREYRNPEASFVAHSEFLRDPKKSFRYGFLFRLDPTDYRAWATGLRRAGYATNPRYPELLISLIERYDLDQYDRPGIIDPIEEDVEPVVEEIIAGIRRTNDVSYLVSEAPLTVAEAARKVNTSVEKLLEYNEALAGPNTTVASGDRVYFQKKRRAYRGRERYHTVEPGEDLYDIAQRYGLRLENLARRNRLDENADPATGSKIKLRGGRVDADQAPRLEGDGREDQPEEPATPPIPTDEDGNLDLDTDDEDEFTGGGQGGIVRPGGPVRPPTPIVPPTIPEGPPTTVPPVPPTDAGQPGQAYTVVPGDTLYGISRRFGLSVAELMQLNKLSSSNLAVGQRLRVR